MTHTLAALLKLFHFRSAVDNLVPNLIVLSLLEEF